MTASSRGKTTNGKMVSQEMTSACYLLLTTFISHDSIAVLLPITEAIETLKGREYS